MKPTHTFSIQEAADAFRAGKRIEGKTHIGNDFALREVAFKGKKQYRFRNPQNSDGHEPGPLCFDTPEDALKYAARKLPHITLSVIDPVRLGTIGTVSLPAPLVPLGPNKTRDGREARVICIDCQSDTHKPVIALVRSPQGHDELYGYEANGRVNDRSEELRDLVGHLPPEPPEPREWRITRNLAGEPKIRSGPTPNKGESVHVREVLPGTDDELEDLRTWKESAMRVFMEIQLQEIGTELGLTLGTDIGPQILPKLRQYRALLKRARCYTLPPLSDEILDEIRP